MRLRVRPAAGRYILALFLVAIEIVRADPDERRRGSTISAAKAILRLPALFTAPVMAVFVFRRMERKLPRWLFTRRARLSNSVVERRSWSAFTHLGWDAAAGIDPRRDHDCGHAGGAQA